MTKKFYYVIILVTLIFTGCSTTKTLTSTQESVTTETVVTHHEVLPPLVEDTAKAVVVIETPAGDVAPTKEILDIVEEFQNNPALKDVKLVANTKHGKNTYTPSKGTVANTTQAPPVNTTNTNTKTLAEKKTTDTVYVEKSFPEKIWDWVKTSFWVIVLGCAVLFVIGIAIRLKFFVKPL